MCNPPFFSDSTERKDRLSSVCPIADSEECSLGGEAGFLERYAQESVSYWEQVKWFTSLVGKRTSFEYIQTYLTVMVDRGDLDLVIATGEIELGKTRRWLLAWQFTN